MSSRDRIETPVGEPDLLLDRPGQGMALGLAICRAHEVQALLDKLQTPAPTTDEDDIEIVIDEDDRGGDGGEVIMIGSAEDLAEKTEVVPPPFVEQMAEESKLGDSVTPPPRTKTPVPVVIAPPVQASSEYERALTDVGAVLIEEFGLPPTLVAFAFDQARARRGTR